MELLLEARDLKKSYQQEGLPDQVVLKGVNVKVHEGETVALLGPSGSGKSTLLNCLGLLDRFNSGSLVVLGEDVTQLSEKARSDFRLTKLGFVFQFHHLIPELSTLENVLLPAAIAGKKRTTRGKDLLALLGLESKIDRYPWQLSGGEQQRVAVARALINEPSLLLTDEATGNLDRARAIDLLQLLLKLDSQKLERALLSVTHDEALSRMYKKRYELKDGQIIDSA